MDYRSLWLQLHPTKTHTSNSQCLQISEIVKMSRNSSYRADVRHMKTLGYKHIPRDYSRMEKKAISMAGQRPQKTSAWQHLNGLPASRTPYFQVSGLACWTCSMYGNSGKLLHRQIIVLKSIVMGLKKTLISHLGKPKELIGRIEKGL